ncbi:MAG TPA: hypothetical protein VIV40_41440 [Kofleriaceae bacterium]
MKKVIAFILLASATSAHADVSSAASWLLSVKGGQMMSNPAPDLGTCHESIEAARKAGKTRLDDSAYRKLGLSKDGTITLEQAEGICRDAVFYRDVVRKDLAVFEYFNDMTWAMMHATTNDTYFKQVEEHADACAKAVDALLALKLDPSTPFKVGAVGHMAETIGDIKPVICDAARAQAKASAKELDDRINEAYEPFIKAGFKGDKLELMVAKDGYLWLAGKRSPDSMKPWLKASVMFSSAASQPDGAGYVTHTVHKYVFKGNTLVNTIDKTYRLRQGAELPASAFK